ncbi:hypothetical protein [Chamaesiphon polymorphus]|uniref:Uncharacterized protein n=1 Tax=Chamaesiphon polymorphus CCALA 037 TaxID=2107692 RepID=A0A2T1GDM8_9CYAN|nr:hypothetical protein [Chamaesiphon polymorphus]PSB55578.1 hypothetical protein C7B77_14595 [Chamaesiphon polymorphus CCALA 037]
MSTLTFKIVFASLISSATLFGAFAIGSVANAAPTVNCTIPNNVSCDISSSKGIKSVKIQSNTPLGTIDLVNKNYDNCPKSVTVTWDSAYQSSNQDIVECQGVSGGARNPGKLKG